MEEEVMSHNGSNKKGGVMKARTIVTILCFLMLGIIPIDFCYSLVPAFASFSNQEEKLGEDTDISDEDTPYILNYKILRFDREQLGKSTEIIVWVNPQGKHFGDSIKSLEFTDSKGETYEFESDEFFPSVVEPYYQMELPYWLPDGDIIFTLYDTQDITHEFRFDDSKKSVISPRLEATSYTGDFSGTNSQGNPVTLSADVNYVEISSKFTLKGLYCTVTADITSKGTSYGSSFSFGSIGDFKLDGSHDSKADRWAGNWSLNDSYCLAQGTGTWQANRYYKPVAVSNIAPADGTIGTVVALTGSGFGSTRGKVTIGGVKTQITNWGTTSVSFLLKKAPSPGPYDLTILPKEPKGVTPTVLGGYFTIMAPMIDSITQSSGSAGESVSIVGKWFGVKKGKVSLADISGHIFKCKVLSWTMDTQTNDGLIVFSVPSKVLGVCDVIVTNKIGSGILPGQFTAK
jgi:hypothetical protein